MGQSSSSSFMDTFGPFLARIAEDPNTFLSDEIINLTYEQLLECINQLNALARKHIDSEENYLKFVPKKLTEDDVFWKITIIIICLKIDSKTNKVISHRKFILPEFWKIFKTIMSQYSTAQQCSKITASKVFQDMSDNQSNSLEGQTECCICFERQPDMSLPCAHSYCAECIEKWKQTNDTCPICRDTMESDEDWELTNIPNSEEIRQEIRSTLSNLTERESAPCSPV